jgi:sulfur-oxidizing protein SoxY
MAATRRTFFKSAMQIALALAGSGSLLKSIAALADWNEAAFTTRGIAATLQALGAEGAVESADIQVIAAEIAENGQVVPVRIVSRIPDTESISVLIENNPNALAAAFTIPPGTEPVVSTRIKMAETADVYGLVLAGGRYYLAAKEIKVTLGGC